MLQQAFGFPLPLLCFQGFASTGEGPPLGFRDPAPPLHQRLAPSFARSAQNPQLAPPPEKSAPFPEPAAPLPEMLAPIPWCPARFLRGFPRRLRRLSGPTARWPLASPRLLVRLLYPFHRLYRYYFLNLLLLLYLLCALQRFYFFCLLYSFCLVCLPYLLCALRDGRKSPRHARRFIQITVFPRRPLPGKILGHSVQLDPLPDPLVHVMMQRLSHRIQERFSRIFDKLKPRSSAMLQVKRLDAVVQPARRSHNRHRTIFQAVHLIQARRFVARGHQEYVRACFHFVRQHVVVGNL